MPGSARHLDRAAVAEPADDHPGRHEAGVDRPVFDGVGQDARERLLGMLLPDGDRVVRGVRDAQRARAELTRAEREVDEWREGLQGALAGLLDLGLDRGQVTRLVGVGAVSILGDEPPSGAATGDGAAQAAVAGSPPAFADGGAPVDGAEHGRLPAGAAGGSRGAGPAPRAGGGGAEPAPRAGASSGAGAAPSAPAVDGVAVGTPVAVDSGDGSPDPDDAAGSAGSAAASEREPVVGSD